MYETRGKRRHPRAPEVAPYQQSSKSTLDKICYNCGNKGHVSQTCPTKLSLYVALDLSPRLYHLGQDNYFGYGVQEDEATKGTGDTIGKKRLTESFRVLKPHSELKRLATKAELKAFPTTTLSHSAEFGKQHLATG